MSLLVLHVADHHVLAQAVHADGSIVAAAQSSVSGPDQHGEFSADDVWRAVLRCVREVDDQVPRGTLRGLRLLTQSDAVVLWDRETLGLPRRGICASDTRAVDVCQRLEDAGAEATVTSLTEQPLRADRVGPKLAWVREHEPRLWTLVVEGSCAAGSLDAFLIARMTRGLHQLTSASEAGRSLLVAAHTTTWTPELCDLFGVPLDALPEISSTPTGVVTDPATFAGLELEVVRLEPEPR